MPKEPEPIYLGFSYRIIQVGETYVDGFWLLTN